MVATMKTVIALPQSLLNHADSLAQQLNISPSRLFELAIEDFIKNFQAQIPLDEGKQTIEAQREPHEHVHSPTHDPKAAMPIHTESRRINQGDIFWIRPQPFSEPELGYYPHPYVVIQDDILNYSRINTVVMCGVTSNLKQANAPGNVVLEVGEANLPKQSIIDVSRVSAVHKSQLGEYIGSLTEQRIDQILAGMRFLQVSFFAR